MLILAAHLGEGTNTLVDPLVTVDLLSTRRKVHSAVSHSWRGSCNNGIDLALKFLLASIDETHRKCLYI